MNKNRVLLAAVLAAAFPLAAFAQQYGNRNANETTVENVGTCGLGSKLFKGNSGLGAQEGAITTNSAGSNTLGVSSGTSGCTQNGVVRSTWRSSNFLGSNKDRLAHDIAKGQGETLQSFAALIGIPNRDRPTFYRVAQRNFARIFPTSNVTTAQVLASLRQVLAENPTLSAYAKSI